jgi:hypothetical protein
MNLISDSNVWYDIAENRRNSVTLKQGGHRLLATPINLLELASGLSLKTFEQRRNAARAVLDYSDGIVTDTETHLLRLWGLNPPDFGIDWRNGFITIADSTTFTEIQSGVNDFTERVVRRVNVVLAREWRTFHWEDFMLKVEDVIDSELVGYKAARRAGNAIHMNQRQSQTFEAKVFSNEAQMSILFGTYFRALMVIDAPMVKPSPEQIAKAQPDLRPYISAYSRYLVKCASTFAPQHNDWGDLENFIYLQDDNRLLTRDDRWITIAAESGSGALLLDPENI